MWDERPRRLAVCVIPVYDRITARSKAGLGVRRFETMRQFEIFSQPEFFCLSPVCLNMSHAVSRVGTDGVLGAFLSVIPAYVRVARQVKSGIGGRSPAAHHDPPRRAACLEAS